MCIRDRLQAGSPQPARPEVPPSGRAGPSAGHRPVATTVPAGECRSAANDNDFPCPTLQPVGVSHMPQAVEAAAGVVLLGMFPQPDPACPAAAGAPSPIGGGTAALLLCCSTWTQNS